MNLIKIAADYDLDAEKFKQDIGEAFASMTSVDLRNADKITRTFEFEDHNVIIVATKESL